MEQSDFPLPLKDHATWHVAAADNRIENSVELD